MHELHSLIVGAAAVQCMMVSHCSTLQQTVELLQCTIAAEQGEGGIKKFKKFRSESQKSVAVQGPRSHSLSIS